MRSFTAIAAVVAVASTAMAYEYEEDIFAREADAEPMFGLNHIGKWLGNAAGSVEAGYEQKAHPYGREQYRRDLEELEELAAREAEAEPILGLNHIGKWMGQAVGSVRGGYEQKAHPHEESSYSSYQHYRRDLEELEDILAAREAEAEPKFGLNHIGKWAGQMAGSVKAGYRSKAGGRRGGRGGRGGSEESSSGSETLSRRDLAEIEEILAAREAVAEPVLGLNHIGKWAGQFAGSIKAGVRSKSGGSSHNSFQDPSAQMYRRDAEFDDEFWYDY